MKLTVNANNTIKNFGHAFSDKFKVISELIQNARRAGATVVDIVYDQENETLSIRDDGAGISDFSTLFVLSQSGWSEEVQGSEQPFGMGFFSVFFACSSVTVQSSGQRIDIDCKKAMELEDFGDVTPDEEVTIGSVITLHGFKNDPVSPSGLLPQSVGSKIEGLAKTSSIAITFNGVMLERPFSLDVLSSAYPVVESPFGTVVVIRPFGDVYKVVAQDLTVFKSHPHASFENYNVIVFANSSVKVRMPDRDSVIDPKAFADEFEQWLHSYYNASLYSLREQISSDADFVKTHFDDLIKYAPDLLCALKFLPSRGFSEVNLPSLRNLYSARELSGGCVSDGDSIFVVDDDYDISEGRNPVISLFLHHAGALIPNDRLPKAHWAWKMAKKLDLMEFEITLINPTFFVFDNLIWVSSGKGIACEAIEIKHTPTGRIVRAARDLSEHGLSAYTFDGFAQNMDLLDVGSYLKPEQVRDEHGNQVNVSGITVVTLYNAYDHESVLLQLNSYLNEFDDTMDDDLAEDSSMLACQVSAAWGKSINELLSEFVGYLPVGLSERLKGKSGSIRFDTDGHRIIFDVAS